MFFSFFLSPQGICLKQYYKAIIIQLKLKTEIHSIASQVLESVKVWVVPVLVVKCTVIFLNLKIPTYFTA